MDVIRPILPVVVLDEKRRSLDPVVVRLARLGGARPSEVNLPDVHSPYLGQLQLGKLWTDSERVLLDEPHQQVSLLLCHLAQRKATRRPGIRLSLLPGLDIGGRRVRIDDDLALAVIKKMKELSRQFLLVGEHLHPLLSAVQHARRVRAHEGR